MLKLDSAIIGTDAEGRCSNEELLKLLEMIMAEDTPTTMLDMTDLRQVIDEKGCSYIFVGEGEGEHALSDAINAAVVSPKATKILSKALGIFLNVEASSDVMTMTAVGEAVENISNASHPDAEIMWNANINDELGDRVRALLVLNRLVEDPTDEKAEPIKEFVSDGEESALKVIRTDNAPAAVGPYSQAIEVNGFVFCSGQIAIDPTVGEIVATDIEGQAEQCCRNVEAVLAETGVEIKNVVKTTCFLADIADFKAFNVVYAKHFVGKPARSCVAVKDLPAGALCEIEVIAVK